MALAPPAWSPSAVLTTHAATAPPYAALGNYATPADKVAGLTKFLTQYSVREVEKNRPPRPA
ncbi:hypothetical protein A0257_21685 [Hymenobacter psoromatis]|nr:hypothetical protein A0257_21685 [Hymenobacter psoromatis]